MSTLAIQHHIADVLVPLGVAGMIVAIASALVAAIAFALRAAGVGGFASASWVGGVILSSAAGYAGEWWPLAVAVCAALLAAAVASLPWAASSWRMPRTPSRGGAATGTASIPVPA